MALTESRKMKCESAWNILIEDWLWEEQAPQIQKVSDRLEHLKPTKKDLMISKIISGAACLAELTSNPKSFSNCPDLHGGVPGGENFKARTVKDIIEPAKSISNKVSVKAALDEMQARGIDSSPVIDQRGELLGTLSKNKMNRNVGGLGHDPKTEPVEAHIEKNNVYCFEDQTIADAEQMMLNAKIGEVLVVTREKLLVGMINIERTNEI